ncbi:MAG: hypothetical protein R2758_01410 [Bacteroidales bacterium]
MICGTRDSIGDWLFYRPDGDNSGMAPAVTDRYLIASASTPTRCNCL